MKKVSFEGQKNQIEPKPDEKSKKKSTWACLDTVNLRATILGI